MNYFDKKYDIEQTESVKEFHVNMRMFAIYKDTLYIAKEGREDSHADWFSQMGWISKDDDSVMDTIVRGFVNKSGVYFYVGYDSRTSNRIVNNFLNNSHLRNLRDHLELSEDTPVYSGMSKNKGEQAFYPTLALGKIKDFVKI